MIKRFGHLTIVVDDLEEVGVAPFHQQSIAASLGELTGAKVYETIAGFIILLLC